MFYCKYQRQRGEVSLKTSNIPFSFRMFFHYCRRQLINLCSKVIVDIEHCFMFWFLKFLTPSWTAHSKRPSSTIIVEGQLLCFRSCPGNLEQDSQINLGCACLRIDKDLLLDPCERLSVRAAALLIPSESTFWVSIFLFVCFVFWRKLVRFSEAFAGLVGSATPSARDGLIWQPAFHPFCTSSVLVVASGPGVHSNSGEVRMWQANCRRMHNLADWISGRQRKMILRCFSVLIFTRRFDMTLCKLLKKKNKTVYWEEKKTLLKKNPTWCMRSRRVSQSAGSTRDVNIAACLTSQEHGVLSCHYFPGDASHIRHNAFVFILHSLLKHI